MTKSSIAIVAAFLLGSTAASAEAFTWGNIYADGYSHNRTTDNKETLVLGVEGGVTTENHDVYGFYEYDATNETTFGKVSDHVKIHDGLTLYGQASNFNTDFGGETVTVVGVGYDKIKGENWSFKPFVGYAMKTGAFAGEDGTMVGWSGYWKPADVMFTNWTEIETNASQPITVDGAVGAFVDITKDIYTGVQYTYSYKTAGELGYGDSVAVRIGMHF